MFQEPNDYRRKNEISAPDETILLKKVLFDCPTLALGNTP